MALILVVFVIVCSTAAIAGVVIADRWGWRRPRGSYGDGGWAAPGDAGGSHCSHDSGGGDGGGHSGFDGGGGDGGGGCH